jgi:hypothetical protein
LVALKNGWARRTASTTSARATAVATASIAAGMSDRGRRNQPDCNERIAEVKRRVVLFVESIDRESSRALGYPLVGLNLAKGDFPAKSGRSGLTLAGNRPVVLAGTHKMALRAAGKCAEIAYREVLSAPEG